MAKASLFKEMTEFDGLYEFVKGNLRSIAIKLTDGNLCLINPLSGTAESAWESLQDIGKVTHIVSPNHYHNKGLKEATEQFPKAQLCASEEAEPRLNKITGLTFDPLKKLETLLPKGVKVEYSKGLKTGEIWFSIKQKKHKILIVADAFCGPKITKNQDFNDTPEILKTFPTYGLKDFDTYHPWADKIITSVNPDTLIPFHGSICQTDKLSARLKTCLNSIN